MSDNNPYMEEGGLGRALDDLVECQSQLIAMMDLVDALIKLARESPDYDEDRLDQIVFTHWPKTSSEMTKQ